MKSPNYRRLVLGFVMLLLGVLLFIFTSGIVEKIGAIIAVVGAAMDVFVLSNGYF